MTTEEIISMAREASAGTSWKPGLGNEHVVAFMERFAALVAADADRWRQAIDHELVVAGLGVAARDADPAELLHQLICWHVDVALDPAVSESACALIASEREACAKTIEAMEHGNVRTCAAAIRARGQA